MTSKRTLERRLDDLEGQPTAYISIGEYWLRELSDDLEDPQEPWSEFLTRINDQ